MTAQVMDDVL